MPPDDTMSQSAGGGGEVGFIIPCSSAALRYLTLLFLVRCTSSANGKRTSVGRATPSNLPPTPSPPSSLSLVPQELPRTTPPTAPIPRLPASPRSRTNSSRSLFLRASCFFERHPEHAWVVLKPPQFCFTTCESGAVGPRLLTSTIRWSFLAYGGVCYSSTVCT